MCIQLEEFFKNYKYIIFKSLAQNEITEQIDQLAIEYSCHHIMIDEFTINTSKLTSEQIEETRNFFLMLKRRFKSTWIVLAR